VPYVDRWWGYATGTLPRCHRRRWALRCRGWPLPAEREMPTQPPMRSKPRTSESASTTSASSGSENSGNVRPRSRGELRRATCLRSPGFAHSCAPSRPKCDTSTTSSTGSTGASRPLGQAAATRAVLVLGAGRRHGTRRISCDRATGWNIRRAGTVGRWRAELGLCRLMQGYAGLCGRLDVRLAVGDAGDRCRNADGAQHPIERWISARWTDCDALASRGGTDGHGGSLHPGAATSTHSLACLTPASEKAGEKAIPPSVSARLLSVSAPVQSVSAPEGIRTPNLLIRSQMLYPLSYGRMCSVVGGGERI
jgi:hypothetical protein